MSKNRYGRFASLLTLLFLDDEDSVYTENESFQTQYSINAKEMMELQLERTEEPFTLTERFNFLPLNKNDDLKTQCSACSKNLRTCTKAALKASHIEYTFTRTILAPLYRRLDEHRLRWDIWISDCRLADNAVLGMASQEPFGGLLSARLQGFHEDLGVIFQGINSIARYAQADIGSAQRYGNRQVSVYDTNQLKFSWK